jgi:hypothetical protein
MLMLLLLLGHTMWKEANQQVAGRSSRSGRGVLWGGRAAPQGLPNASAAEGPPGAHAPTPPWASAAPESPGRLVLAGTQLKFICYSLPGLIAAISCYSPVPICAGAAQSRPMAGARSPAHRTRHCTVTSQFFLSNALQYMQELLQVKMHVSLYAIEWHARS